MHQAPETSASGVRNDLIIAVIYTKPPPIKNIYKHNIVRKVFLIYPLFNFWHRQENTDFVLLIKKWPLSEWHNTVASAEAINLTQVASEMILKGVLWITSCAFRYRTDGTPNGKMALFKKG